MDTTTLIVALTAGILGSPIPDKVVENQDKTFQKHWGTDFVWKFDDLPTKGVVPKHRLPYSGYIYPDRSGGTGRVLQKYDYAFNRGRSSAASWERWDVSSGAQAPRRRGWFGWRSGGGVPHWYGHCNGWTAATIRHAEPKKSVRYNGVTFTPTDIKGLLAEIYIYNDSENLLGSHYRVNAGAFHAVLANWLGRGSYPVGMEADPGEEKWNYPIYSYAYSSAKRRNQRVEVKINLAYAKDSNGEHTVSPHIRRIKYFHYMLELNDEGEITGGSFFYDSSRIDMLWVPVRPRPGGQEGNRRGNPHVNVNTVLAIWRDSVDEDVRKKWFNIDPPKEDQIADVSGVEGIVPLQGLARAKPKPPAVDAEETKPDEEAVATRTEDDEAETPAAEPAEAEADAEEGTTESSETEPATEAEPDGDSEMADAGTAAEAEEEGDAESTDSEPAAADAEEGGDEPTEAEPAAEAEEDSDAESTDSEATDADAEEGGDEPAEAEPAAEAETDDDSEMADAGPAAEAEEDSDAESTDSEPAAVDAENEDSEPAEAEPATGEEETADANTTDAEPTAAEVEDGNAEATDEEPVAEGEEGGDSMADVSSIADGDWRF